MMWSDPEVCVRNMANMIYDAVSHRILCYCQLRYHQHIVTWYADRDLGPHRFVSLTHWGRVTHICVGKLTIIGSDNGSSPGRRQAIIWTNDRILLIVPLETKFNEIFIKIHTSSFKTMHLKLSSGKCRPFCLGLNVLIIHAGNKVNL